MNNDVQLIAWRAGRGDTKLTITTTKLLLHDLLAWLRTDGYNEFDIRQ